MNNDELKSMLVKIGLILFTSLASKFHIDQNIVAAVVSDVADIAVLAYGIYSHRGMIKVPAPVTPPTETKP